MKRYVGIMVNGSLYKRIPKSRTFHEAIAFYEEAGRAHGLVPCFFRLRDVGPKQSEVLAYVKGKNGYLRRRVPVPKVVHNRSMYFKASNRRRIDQLVSSGIHIFNRHTRYGKLKVQQILMESPEIRPHLPETEPATEKALLQMMEKHASLIIKPNSGSIGRGIMKLEKSEDRWQLTYPNGKKRRVFRTVTFRENLPAALRRALASKKYMIQQRLPLATYHGRPFDLRVSVQRNETGDWQVTGIVGKAAKPRYFLTNIAQGASVYKLDKFLQEFPDLSYEKVKENIERFSLKVAEHLSRHLPDLADIGLDVAITEHGYPMFVECNARDLRYSFNEGSMAEAWKATYANPIGYAKYLLDRPQDQVQNVQSAATGFRFEASSAEESAAAALNTSEAPASREPHT